MTDLDRLKQIVAGIVRVLTSKFDYHALYPAMVVSQNADGTLELKPDDARFGPGISSVPIRLGLPGAMVKVKSPSRVLLGFAGGDPQRPVATVWDASTLDTLTVTASTKVSVTAPSVQITSTQPGGVSLGDQGASGGSIQPLAGQGDLVQMAVSGQTVNLVGPLTMTPGSTFQFSATIAGTPTTGTMTVVTGTGAFSGVGTFSSPVPLYGQITGARKYCSGS